MRIKIWVPNTFDRYLNQDLEKHLHKSKESDTSDFSMKH